MSSRYGPYPHYLAQCLIFPNHSMSICYTHLDNQMLIVNVGKCFYVSRYITRNASSFTPIINIRDI